ncbi:hypothetical protein OG810_35985 [Streptomyces sp. NBC_01693]|nr:hypothetical protein [Streptomyces sp. NBC_01693]
MGIAYNHHRPGTPSKFVLDSPLRVGQPSRADTKVQSVVERVQERRKGARRGGRDRNGVGPVAAAESSLQHGLTLYVLRRDDTQQRAGRKDVVQVPGKCAER